MPLTHSMSTRGLMGLASKRSPKKSDLTSASGDLVTREASTVTGFLLGILESAAKTKDTAPVKVPSAVLRRNSPVKLTRGLSRTASPANLAMSMTDPEGDIGADVPAIVELLTKQRYCLDAQMKGIGQLLRRLRHDDASTYQAFAAMGGLALLLLAMREFRFHAPLQTEIAQALSLFCKFSDDYVELLLKECPMALIAKTMVLHPKEEHFQLHMSVVQASLKHHTTDQNHQIAYFNDHRPVAPDVILTTLPRNPPPTISTTQRPPLWLPSETTCSKHHHEAFDLDEPPPLYTPALSSKSIRLAEQSRTPTTSNSPLRRVLSTPKMPHLSPDCALSDRPETPVIEAPRATTVPLVAVRQWAPDECHPRTAVGYKRQFAEPHTKSTPTLGAYKAAPLFVEPIALAARMHAPPEAKAKRPRSVLKATKSFVPPPLSEAAPSCDVRKESVSPPQHNPASLQEHHAAMTLQRYFRRNLLTPAEVQTATRTQPREVENSAALSAAYEAREAETTNLRTIQVHFCKGLAHQEAGEWELAEECYALALDVPTSVAFATIRVNLASACLSQGKFADAQRILSSAVAIAPTCVPALYNHGLADWHMGELRAAATKFTKVLTLAPSHGKAIYALHVLKTKFHTVIHE